MIDAVNDTLQEIGIVFEGATFLQEIEESFCVYYLRLWVVNFKHIGGIFSRTILRRFFGDFKRDYLGGGDDFSSVLFSGIYGPYVNDLSLKSDTNNEIFNPHDLNFSDRSFCDDELASPNCVDYFYPSGKVYGHIEIVGLEIANFDINRLIFKFSK